MEFNYNYQYNNNNGGGEIDNLSNGISKENSTIQLSLALEHHLSFLLNLNKSVGLGLNDTEIKALAHEPIPILTRATSQIPVPVLFPVPVQVQNQIPFSPAPIKICERRKSVISKLRRKIMEKQCKKQETKETAHCERDRFLFNISDPAPCFCGRENFLQDLHIILHSNPNSSSNQNHQLTVLCQSKSESEPQRTFNGVIDGGSGKSEIVRKYISNYGQLYKNIIWLEAESHHSLVHSFYTLAGQMDIKSAVKSNLNTRKLVSVVYAKLVQSAECNSSLIVFDNAMDFQTIQNFLPKMNVNENLNLNRQGTISILITSRNPCWENISLNLSPCEPESGSDSRINVKLLELTPLPKSDSVKFLMDQIELPDNPENRRDSEELADLLGGSPLALNLAIAYIKELWLEAKSFFGFDYKISNYTSKWRAVLEKQTQKNRPELSSPAALIYFTTFIVSLKRLGILKHGEVAIKIMQVLAFLSPAEISLSFLLSLLQNFERRGGIDEHSLKNGVKLLEKFSLVTYKNSSSPTNSSTSNSTGRSLKSSISIHSTLQIIILQQLEESGDIFAVCDTLVKNCAAILSRTSVDDIRKNVEIILHIEHILSDPLFTSIEKCDETSLNLIYVFGRVMFDVGGIYRESSLKYFKQLYGNCEQLFGENHKRTIVAEYDCAYVVHTLEKQGYLNTNPPQGQGQSNENQGPRKQELALELLSRVMKKAGIHLGLTHQLTVSARKAIISILNERDQDKD